MKLVRLILENIKSYSSETIDFYEGVNFISGINGAGKTTIIEAVGYAIFDSNPFSAQKHFIKKGEKTGIITVIVEAKDERLYRIVRRLREPSGGSWAIYDAESGSELNELHGNQDVKAWLAANLGIGKGLDPVRLFEDVIGISQGKFITPFLERPKDRKKIFNTILQLETYREAFDKSSRLASTLKEGVAEKEGEKKALLVKAEDLQECRDKLKENQEKVNVTDRKMRMLTKELSAIEEEILIHEKHKKELENSRNRLHMLGIKLAALTSRKESLEIQLKEAKLNKLKAEHAQAGSKEYEKQKQIEKILAEKRKKRDILNNITQELKNSIVSLKSQIKSNKENREKQIQQLKKDVEEIVRDGEMVSAQREKAAKKLKEFEERQKELAQDKGVYSFLQKAGNLTEQYKVSQKARLENYEHLINEKKNIQASLKNWAEKEKCAAGLAGLEEQYDRIRGELTKNQARLTTLKKNREDSSDGMCPFLNMPCLNIEGDLQEHFNREIKEIVPEIEQLGKEEKAVVEQISLAKAALEEFYVMQHQKKQLDRIAAQENEILENLKKEGSVLAQAVNPQKIQPLYLALTNIIESFQKMGLETDSEISPAIQKMQVLLDGYRELYNGILINTGCHNKEKELEVLLIALGTMKEQAGILWDRVEFMLNLGFQDYKGTLTACDTKLGSLRDSYRKANEQLKAVNNDGLIREKETELQAKEQEMSGRIEELKRYSGLEEEWQTNQEMMKRYETDYLQYMQNKDSILKYESLKKELERTILDETKLKQEEEEYQALLIQIEKQYDPELLLELRNKSTQMSVEKGRIETDLNHALKEVEHYTYQVHEKETVLQEIRQLEKAIKREKKAQELLSLVRIILNKSGEEIAELYRQHLSREANSIYQQIAKDNVSLYWGDDYELKLLENQEQKEGGRTFAQLSGGEKMTSALAVRLALLKQLSGLGIGFFDEPTANLDEHRRNNLAGIIPQVTRDFRQLFLISHDDTFDSITDNIIYLKKGSLGTKVVE